MKIFKIEKMVKIENFPNCPSFVFDQKLFITIFLQMLSLHKIHSHVHSEEYHIQEVTSKTNKKQAKVI